MASLPYKIIYVFLTVALFEAIYLLVLVNVIYKDNFTGFLIDVQSYRFVKLTIIDLEQLKLAIILTFYLFLTFRYHCLLMFVRFQNTLTLERLPVEKDIYQKREKALQRTYISIFCIMMITVIGFIAGATAYSDKTYTVISYQVLITIIGLVTAAKINFYTGISLL